MKQGWKPLCEFLGCEIPDQEFPRQNVKGEGAKWVNSMITDAINEKTFYYLCSFCFSNKCFLYDLFLTISSGRPRDPKRGGGGVYYGNFWAGMCRWDPGTLSLCQS